MTHVQLNRKAIDDVASIATVEGRKAAIKAQVGDLSGIDVMYNMVLIGTYVRSNKSAGGILLTANAVEEDVWQGKVGLVLKMGADAFQENDEVYFNGQAAEVDDWVVFKVGDAWQLTINGWPCRLVRDSAIRMKIDDPRSVI
jgi:co-chaperonin GroES (HSP10)